jgi:glyoxylase-like metal-dependent hydrolase (beta-lactamase superfamily II)
MDYTHVSFFLATMSMLLQFAIKESPMDANIYHFKVGEFDCTIVNDGTYSYPQPGKLFFEDVPLDRLAAALERYDIDLDTWDVYVSPYPSLVIDTGEQRVLVDTGMGPLVPTTGNLRRNLMAAGFSPGEIDIVILTHAHPDHIGGNLDEEGKPAFPNARWVMGRSEWEFWTGEPDLSALRDDHFIPMMLASAGANLPPIEPLLDFVKAGDEIVPGIKAIAASGHTPGQMALSVTSQGEQLLALADAVIHPLHIEQPDWVAPLDLMVNETVVTRRRLLGQAAVEKMLVFAPHFAFPSLGHVILEGDGWRWQAIFETEVSAGS